MSSLTAALPEFELTPRKGSGISPASFTILRQWFMAHEHAVAPVSRQPIGQRFAELAATWREERGFTSSVNDMILSHSYQRIVALGLRALPYILLDLKSGPDHWFPALAAITGANPVPPEAAGDLHRMAAEWLRWGDEEGLVD